MYTEGRKQMKKYLSIVLCLGACFVNSIWAYQAPPMDMTPQAVGRSQEAKAKDLDITDTIQRKIRDDYDLEKYADNIGVYTYDGYVTLTGIVDSHQARIKLEQVARTASGVRNVDMHVDVNTTKSYKEAGFHNLYPY